MRKVPQRFHFDKHIPQILKELEGGKPDDLFTTSRVAAIFRNSPEWFEIARSGGYGPEATAVSRRCIRYRRDKLIKFLRERLRAIAKINSLAA